MQNAQTNHTLILSNIYTSFIVVENVAWNIIIKKKHNIVSNEFVSYYLPLQEL